MARGEPFEQHTGRYDAWFEHHHAAYVSELLALRPEVPMQNTFWTALITSLPAAAVTTAGVWTIHRFADWGERDTTYF